MDFEILGLVVVFIATVAILARIAPADTLTIRFGKNKNKNTNTNVVIRTPPIIYWVDTLDFLTTEECTYLARTGCIVSLTQTEIIIEDLHSHRRAAVSMSVEAKQPSV